MKLVALVETKLATRTHFIARNTHHLRNFVEGLSAVLFNGLDAVIDTIGSPSLIVVGHLDGTARIVPRGQGCDAWRSCRCGEATQGSGSSGAASSQSQECHVVCACLRVYVEWKRKGTVCLQNQRDLSINNRNGRKMWSSKMMGRSVFMQVQKSDGLSLAKLRAAHDLQRTDEKQF